MQSFEAQLRAEGRSAPLTSFSQGAISLVPLSMHHIAIADRDYNRVLLVECAE